MSGCSALDNNTESVCNNSVMLSSTALGNAGTNLARLCSTSLCDKQLSVAESEILLSPKEFQDSERCDPAKLCSKVGLEN